MSNNLDFITSINAAKLRLLSELDEGNKKTSNFDASKSHHKTYKTCKTSMKMTIKEAQAAVDEWIKTEMADILWVLICLANQTGVDLTEAFAKNMEKKTQRDKERHLRNEKLK